MDVFLKRGLLQGANGTYLENPVSRRFRRIGEGEVSDDGEDGVDEEEVGDGKNR